VRARSAFGFTAAIPKKLGRPQWVRTQLFRARANRVPNVRHVQPYENVNKLKAVARLPTSRPRWDQRCGRGGGSKTTPEFAGCRDRRAIDGICARPAHHDRSEFVGTIGSSILLAWPAEWPADDTLAYETPAFSRRSERPHGTLTVMLFPAGERCGNYRYIRLLRHQP
jgi:hypothetical protein